MDDRKQLVLRLSPELHKAFKRYALEKDKTMTDIVIEWINKNCAEEGSGREMPDGCDKK